MGVLVRADGRNGAGPALSADERDEGDGDGIAAIRRHPAFEPAVETLFRTVTRHQAESGTRRFVLGDRARRLAFWTAMALDAERRDGSGPGLRVNRFCDALAASGDMSRGRARAIFLVMKHYGFIEPLEPARRGKPQLCMPSERMLTLARERLTAAVTAAAAVSRAGALALDRLEDPLFLTRFFRAARHPIADGPRPLERSPFLGRLVGRDAGEYVLMHLHLAHREASPAERASGLPVTAGEMAARYHVSRTHVSTLLKRAAEEGLLEKRGKDRLVVLPAFEGAVHDALASTLAMIVAMLAIALEAPPDGHAAAVPPLRAAPACPPDRRSEDGGGSGSRSPARR